MSKPTLELPSYAPAAQRERQTTIFEWMEGLARRAGSDDPTGPALGLFCATLALMALGLMIQAAHAASVSAPAELMRELSTQSWFRMVGLLVLLAAARLGPWGVRRFVPALMVGCTVLLIAVYVPQLGAARNGAHRWIQVLHFTFQPSELARVAIVLWVADRCVRLGSLVRDTRRGLLPMLTLVLTCFALIAAEPDLGGSVLFLVCALATLWVGGARATLVFGSLTTVVGGALLVAMAFVPYIQRRVETFLGHQSNLQVEQSELAIDRGDFLGAGLGQGTARTEAVPYLDSDYVFAQVGEELGLFGMLLVVGLYSFFLASALRLVLSIPDRFSALAAFGLLVSVCLQAMLHLQIVSGLAPPKGMTLPLISDGGTSLVVTCLAVGLALGAVRSPRRA